MILDRIFGLIAAAAFALGVVLQVELLSRTDAPDTFDPLLVAFVALALLAIGYITLRADRRYGFIDPYDESVDLVEVAFSLPRWAIAVSGLLSVYVVLLCAGLLDVTRNGAHFTAQLPDELAVLRRSLPANGIRAVLASLFVVSSFVIAAFYLFRKPIKEF